MRSPRMPKNGEKREPTHASAAKATRYWTEPVAVSTYQPRISASISKASDVARSAGHWKRKLRMRKGARAGLRAASIYVSGARGRAVSPGAVEPVTICDRSTHRIAHLRAARPACHFGQALPFVSD